MATAPAALSGDLNVRCVTVVRSYSGDLSNVNLQIHGTDRIKVKLSLLRTNEHVRVRVKGRLTELSNGLIP